jgi:hypothetical protein
VLNNEQIQALANIGKMKVKCCDGIAIAVSSVSHREIKYPYEDFIKKMNLKDLRLSWLLGNNNMIAGGSVLNWIWGENTHGDIDFFFKNEEYADIFVEFIKGIGFKLACRTTYARTYFEPLQGIILQVVGNPDRGPYAKQGLRDNFVAYGTPQEVIDNFDFHVCKFAVDSDYLYTTSRAIQDLLKLTIDSTSNERSMFLQRILKYTHKGFFMSSRIKGHLRYDKPVLQEKNRDQGEWV